MNTTPHTKGILPVSSLHSIYYEVVGNPKGKPVLFLHGGPGVGFDDHDKRFFDFEKLNVIFFDQRGAGRSTPFAELKENTTPDLISDINKLLDHLGFKKVFIFGGSWGATLALFYALQNVERVTGLLLRGTWLGNADDMEYWFGNGARNFFPDAWDRFMSFVPKEKRNDCMKYYLDKMLHGDEKTKDTYAYEWDYFESALLKMHTSEKDMKEMMSGGLYKAIAPLEAHYMIHHCFMPDTYIEDNITKLSNIPVTFVHGRYDVNCPPINSYKLHKKLPSSKLYFVVAGHSSSEPEIEKKLIEEMKGYGNS